MTDNNGPRVNPPEGDIMTVTCKPLDAPSGYSGSQPSRAIPTKWAAISGWLSTLHGKLTTDGQKELCSKALEQARQFRSFLDDHYPGVTEPWGRKYSQLDARMTVSLEGNLAEAVLRIQCHVTDSSYCTACQANEGVGDEYGYRCENCAFGHQFGGCGGVSSDLVWLYNWLDNLRRLLLDPEDWHFD